MEFAIFLILSAVGSAWISDTFEQIKFPLYDSDLICHWNVYRLCVANTNGQYIIPGPLLLIWGNFNLSVDKQSHTQ